MPNTIEPKTAGASVVQGRPSVIALRFDLQAPIVLSVHQALGLIESIATILQTVTGWAHDGEGR